MDALLVRASEILFSNGMKDKVLLRVLDILRDDDPDLKEILQLSIKVNSNLSATISHAVSIRFGGEDKWLSTISDFTLDEIKPSFALIGIVLGIFKAVNWYDEEWGKRTSFCEFLPHTIYQFIMCQSASAKNTGIALGQDDKEGFSTSIKKYVRADKTSWQESDRLVHIARILKKVKESCDSQNLTPDDLSPLGTLILDQLLYGIFGNVSIFGRFTGMEHVMNGNYPRICRVEQEKTS